MDGERISLSRVRTTVQPYIWFNHCNFSFEYKTLWTYICIDAHVHSRNSANCSHSSGVRSTAVGSTNGRLIHFTHCGGMRMMHALLLNTSVPSASTVHAYPFWIRDARGWAITCSAFCLFDALRSFSSNCLMVTQSMLNSSLGSIYALILFFHF